MIMDNKKLLKRYIEVLNEVFKSIYLDENFVSKFSKIKYQLLNDKNKKMIDEVKSKSINVKIHNMIKSLNPDWYFNVWIESQVNEIMFGHKINPQFFLDLDEVMTSNFSSEDMKKNIILLKYLFFINLASLSNVNEFDNKFNNFLNHYDISYKKFKETFTEEEKDFYNEILEEKKYR